MTLPHLTLILVWVVICATAWTVRNRQALQRGMMLTCNHPLKD